MTPPKTLVPLTDTERELIASAIVWTRVSNFTDGERVALALLVERLGPTKWDNTRGALNVLPVEIKNRHYKRQKQGGAP